ncbi:energy-coupling factor transporter transmembrane component T family protein [Chachezhania antarctica]|uniref:energy-coupling factor transporter transmembrane component T family protein n=1 Tax=Chachezhania antarctica TaxID=2340860 RepID=UPI0013CEEEDF|nr:energy-coupling factor transporter transmembrane protein EcfT [Chachezhania antarctica]
MIGALSARHTRYHDWHAGWKLVGLCVFCTVIGFAQWVVAGWTGLILVLGAARLEGGWFLRMILGDLKSAALIAALIAAFQLALGSPMKGLEIAGGLLACIAAAMMMTRTTSPAELLDTVDGWLETLGMNERPRRKLALAVALTLRFVPALSERAQRLTEAHRARSPKRAGWRILPPLAIGALDEADRAAEALRARADLN